MTRLITDTSANLPKKLQEELDVQILSFQYSVNDVPVEYEKDWDTEGKNFFDAMRQGAVVNTSLVSVGSFIDCFEPILEAGDDVVYVGMSGGVSGTANAAVLAARDLCEKYPERHVVTFDTYGAGLGEGLMVMLAAELIKAGKTAPEVEQQLLERREHLCQYFTVDDLQYLKRTGRVSGATAAIANVLSIKPILVGDETGHIVASAKERGTKRAMQHLVNKYDELVENKSTTIAISHADEPERAGQLLDMLKAVGFDGECIISMWEPVTGSHVGPGSLGLFFWGVHK